MALRSEIGSMRSARVLAGAACLALAGCGGVQLTNTEPARTMAQQRDKPPGSVYTGWRVFQDKCARCHGPAATGTLSAPDLMPRVREMGERRFIGLVLRRYDWSLPASEASREGAAREALIDEVLQRRAGPLTMPAWQGEPRVEAHIADLYAWLSARAAGTQGPGRPAY